MTAEPRQSDPFTPPVLVLALGNTLLRDDGVGMTLLELVRERYGEDPRVELIDGGTQGLALIGWLADRHAVLVLDAVSREAAAGTVHVVRDARNVLPTRGSTAHESSASDLLHAAALLGDCPETAVVVGVEPEEVRTGVSLSEAVHAAVPEATRVACEVLDELLAALGPRQETMSCTS